jgi:hypothetical protein
MMGLGVERSLWLGELAGAVDEARRLMREYGMSVRPSAEALDLQARLELVRDEIERIRRARGDGSARLRDFGPSEAFVAARC